MASTVINNRDDLDAIAGTIEHDVFMAALRGTLWRLEKDDSVVVWRAIEDNSTIQRFGFTRADFPGAVAPELPAYVPPPSGVPQAVTMRQARLALLGAGLLTQINAAVANMPGAEGDAARIEWEFSSTVERNRPYVISLAGVVGLTPEQLDALFIAAQEL